MKRYIKNWIVMTASMCLVLNTIRGGLANAVTQPMPDEVVSSVTPRIVGYWECWNISNLRLKDISPKYNVINVAFGVPRDSSHEMIIHGLGAADSAMLKSDILALQSQGKKILLSIGGATHSIQIETQTQKAIFVSSLIRLVEEYNFDGIDIDIETVSLDLDADDYDFTSPTTPRIVNLIGAIQEICAYFSDQEFWLTAAPETAYLQPYYSGVSNHGAYLPILHALRNEFAFIHPQFYNSGSMYGGDGQVYFPGTPDFLVALSEPLITGFYVINDRNEYRFFEGLRADQVAIGLLTTASEGSGYMESSEINKALDYLTKGISFGGAYILQNPSGYPDFSGIMGWSINCDKRDHDYAFVNNADEYFFGSITP